MRRTSKEPKNLNNYPNRFVNEDEVLEIITKLYEKEWRCLELPKAENWALKYIRIYRSKKGLLVCDSNNKSLNKDIFSCIK